MKEGRGIEPNFIKEVQRRAEERLSELIEIARDIGVEVFSLEHGRDEIIEAIQKKLPERYEVVMEKLKAEGLTMDDLTEETLIDRFLGIDSIIRYEGKNYAIDVTTGQSTVVKNKKRKISEMEEIYKELGIDNALIIRLKEDVTEDTVVDLFSKIEDLDAKEGVFSMVVRYPDTTIGQKVKYT